MYKTRAITKEEFIEIIDLIKKGGYLDAEPNEKVAFALVLEGNLCMRIGDILNLSLSDIIKDGNRYHLQVIEEKTKKARTFTIPLEIYQYIQQYCIDNNIKRNDKIFNITTRQVQRVLKKACDYLGLENVSTHSFRKFGATEIYIANDYDIMLVKEILQHASVETTQEYLGIRQKRIEKALQDHICLV